MYPGKNESLFISVWEKNHADPSIGSGDTDNHRIVQFDWLRAFS